MPWSHHKPQDSGFYNLGLERSEEEDDIDSKRVETNSNMVSRKRSFHKSSRYLKEVSFFGQDLNSKKAGKKENVKSHYGKGKNAENFQDKREYSLNVHNIDKASRYVFPMSFLFLNIFYFTYSCLLHQAI